MILSQTGFHFKVYRFLWDYCEDSQKIDSKIGDFISGIFHPDDKYEKMVKIAKWRKIGLSLARGFVIIVSSSKVVPPI